MDSFADFLVLTRICAANARAARTKQAARELWKMASEYRERAMALDSGQPIDIGLRPECLND